MFSFLRSIKILTNKSQIISIYLLFIGGLFSMLFEAIGLGLIGVYVLAISDISGFIDKIPFDFIANYFLTLSKFHLILTLSIILVLVFFFKNLFTLLYAYFESRTNRSIILSNSEKLYDIYLKKPYSFFLKQNPQKLVNNINHVLKMGISYIFFNILLFREIFLVFILISSLVFISWQISIIIFLTLSITTFVIFFLIKKKFATLGEQIVNSSQTILKDLNEGIRGIKLSKLLKHYEYLTKKFILSLNVRETSQLKHAIYQKIPRAALEIFSVLIVVSVSIILILKFDDPSKFFPILATLSLILLRMVPSFTNINYALSNLKYTSSAHKSLIDDLSDDHYIRNLENNIYEKKNIEDNLILKKNFDVKLKNISFSYEGIDKKTLQDISIGFSANTAIGFVGKSGSGKTTLVDVVIGLLKPSSGHIEINDKKVNIFESSQWQRQIGYVPQDVILNNSTIKENIAYGVKAKDINDNKVLETISKAQLNDFIESLPNGINYVVRDLGKNMSGGQKQRMGIARALYHDPKILVLDEATGALDENNEQKILSNLKSMIDEITIIIIAHKYSTIKFCDKVFLLKSGKYIGSGSPKNLLNNLDGFS